MPKYRNLTLSELDQLEGVFIKYLAANGISAEYWQKLKDSDDDRIKNYISDFSDMIFDSAIENTDLLELRNKHSLNLFKIIDNTIVFRRIEIIGDENFDFSQEFNISDLMSMIVNNPHNLNIYRGKKEFKEDINFEIFKLIESGYKISRNTELWDILKD